MIKVSQNIVWQRWDSLPDNLREAMVSEENSNFLDQIAKSESLPPAKFKAFSKLAGYVMLGFIHPDDLGKELQDNLHLPFQTAKNLETALKEKIFNQYSVDLQKIYSPVSERDFGLAPDRRTEERGIPRPVLMKETPGPTILHQEETIPKPTGKMPVPKPGTPIPKPSAPVPKPNIPMPSTPRPAAPTRPQVLSPFGFQKEARPLNTPSEFKLGGIPRPNIANATSTPTAPKPARVELGGEEKKQSQPAQTGKVVGREPIHYSEPKSVFMPSRINTPPIPASKKPEMPIPPKS